VNDAAEYLTVPQVAALLQVSAKSVFRWATEDATMPVLRMGRTVRVPRDRFLRWLQAREQGRIRPRRPSDAGTVALTGPSA
jgi:excisionase family DNA binding protein